MINWLVIILAAAVMVVMFLLKRSSFLPSDRARQLLREGALVVDVRSPGEFSSGHLPSAINIPLGSLSTEAPRQFQNKDQVLLLHCLSGARSGIATRRLKQLGYLSAHNLGSYGRAERLVRGTGKK